jgi:crotonobetainyl-CoA:carnitine CoA-transferase CaiB-like acyl-CoA transferase
MFRMQATPGAIRFAGRRLGQDNHTIYAQRLGLTPDRIADLRDNGVL